jgi:CDP-glucose 4,6-dehydratase
MELGQRALENLGMNPSFWKHKKVLLTGHTGFKGSWLSLWLQDLGADVTGYSIDVPTDPSLYGAADVGDGMDSVTGDVRDLASLRSSVDKAGPEIIIHMAAQSLVRRSYADPVGTYDTNIMGTVNLLEAVRDVSGVRVIIVVTSDKCYDNEEHEQGYCEGDPMGGYDPYSSSKGCAELVTAAYRNSFFNNADFDRHETAVASVRAGNVIGGGDWAEDRLIPDIVAAFQSGRSPDIRNPQSVRPWQFVLDPLNGYLTLAESMWNDARAFAGAWNFGPDDSNAKEVGYVAT